MSPKVNTNSLHLHITACIAWPTIIHLCLCCNLEQNVCNLKPLNSRSLVVSIHCVAFTCFTTLVKIALHTLKHVQYKQSKPHDQRE